MVGDKAVPYSGSAELQSDVCGGLNLNVYGMGEIDVDDLQGRVAGVKVIQPTIMFPVSCTFSDS